MSILPIALAASVLALAADPALANAGGKPDDLIIRLATDLVGLFVVATLVETALNTIFNWRVYREFLNGRAVKTLVMIVVGLAVVKGFDYDIVDKIVSVASDNPRASGGLSQLLSALVIAGGSATVYQLFKALGLRPPVDPDEKKAQPPENKAWVSVRIIRKKAVGDVQLHIEAATNPSEEAKSKPPLAGIVRAPSSLATRLRLLFLADPTRFPSYGGRTFTADDTVYRIVATGLASVGDGEPPAEFRETIYEGRLASRALLDFVYVI